MFEKVNPSHPDKIADRIAGAIVDLAYSKEEDPKVAVEVLLGHGICHVIAETSIIDIKEHEIKNIVSRIAGTNVKLIFDHVPQDMHLAENQVSTIKCGDNGIFKGMPVTYEQNILSQAVRRLYEKHPYDGKYIISDKGIVACQSHVNSKEFIKEVRNTTMVHHIKCNPLGDWTGGIDVDTGATNRKLGSDMGDSVTGGGLHGKDLSKADVSINIYAWLKAQQLGRPILLYCAIGDEKVDGVPYSEIVDIARDFIGDLGGFEKFAEWGLI